MLTRLENNKYLLDTNCLLTHCRLLDLTFASQTVSCPLVLSQLCSEGDIRFSFASPGTTSSNTPCLACKISENRWTLGWGQRMVPGEIITCRGKSSERMRDSFCTQVIWPLCTMENFTGWVPVRDFSVGESNLCPKFLSCLFYPMHSGTSTLGGGAILPFSSFRTEESSSITYHCYQSSLFLEYPHAILVYIAAEALWNYPCDQNKLQRSSFLGNRLGTM